VAGTTLLGASLAVDQKNAAEAGAWLGTFDRRPPACPTPSPVDRGVQDPVRAYLIVKQLDKAKAEVQNWPPPTRARRPRWPGPCWGDLDKAFDAAQAANNRAR